MCALREESFHEAFRRGHLGILDSREETGPRNATRAWRRKSKDKRNPVSLDKQKKLKGRKEEAGLLRG